MVELYMLKGFSREDAETIIRVYTSKPEYSRAFVDHMMVEELGVIVPSPRERPWILGLATTAAFAVGGALPLIAALFAPVATSLPAAAVATALATALVAALKAHTAR